MVLNELCLTCVQHFLMSGTGNLSNAKSLAVWSYHYADYAYAEAGFRGEDYISLAGQD